MSNIKNQHRRLLSTNRFLHPLLLLFHGSRTCLGLKTRINKVGLNLSCLKRGILLNSPKQKRRRKASIGMVMTLIFPRKHRQTRQSKRTKLRKSQDLRLEVPLKLRQLPKSSKNWGMSFITSSQMITGTFDREMTGRRVLSGGVRRTTTKSEI